MKKAVILALTVCLCLALFAGCTTQTGDNQRHLPGDNTSPGNSTATNEPSAPVNEPAVTAANPGDVINAPENNYWPADLTPDLPEYSYGKITGFTGPDADNEIIIKAGDTNKNDLDNYLKQLEDEGWTVSNISGPSHNDYATAKKGYYSVTFQIQADTYVQFDITIAKSGGWPSADEYPVKLPQPEGYEVIDVQLEPQDLDGVEYYIFRFSCIGMDQAAAEAYVSGNTQSGYDWNGEHWNYLLDDEFPYLDGDKMMFEYTVYPDSIS